MKRASPLFALFAILAWCTVDASAQPQWVVGGRLGLSIYTVGGGSSYFDPFFGQTIKPPSSTQAGLQIGPSGEVIFNRRFAICMDLNLNTQGGTPIEWANTFKMYFNIPGSKIRPYGDAGFNLFFYTGGPYFGIRAGGGALFPIAQDLYVPADLQFGPVFATGITPFYIAVTSGIRYEIR
ncbi:MAG: hypothetical protein AB1428_11325 [Bacteroidota bacterium]